MKKFTLLLIVIWIVSASSVNAGNLNHMKWIQKWNTVALKLNLTESPFQLPGLPVAPILNPGVRLKSGMFTHRLDSVVTHHQYEEAMWDKETLTEFQYDSDNRSEIWTESLWDVDRQVWNLLDRLEFSYDAGGLLEEIRISTFNEEATEFLPEMKIVMDYNPEAMINSVVFFEVVDGTETEILMQLYYYTESGLPEAVELLYYEDEWLEVFRTEYVYNAQDKKTADYTYYIMEDEEFLIGSVEYTLDPAGRISESVYSWVNENTMVIENVSRINYEYTVHGDILVLYDQDWNAEISEWEENLKQMYEYDDNLNVSNIIFPYSTVMSDVMDADLLFSNKMPTAVKVYYYHDGNYINTTNDIYHYSELTSFADNPDRLSGLKVYPVPAGCCVTFQWTGNLDIYRLEVFHVSGSLLIDRQISRLESVNVENLRSGIYLYRLSDDRGSAYSGKLLVR
jgi:hypothetical protein